MFHILHPLSHHIHFRARTQPRASHERAGTWMIPFLGISNHRNPLVRQPPIQKSNLKLCKSQNMSKHIGIISEPYFFTWKIMKVRIVTTQNLSATICHPGFFFTGRFLRGRFCAKTHCSFRSFPPERFSLWLSSKAWRWGDPKWKPAAAPFPLKDGCNSLNMFKRAP